MPLTPTQFGQLAQGMGAFVLVCALITGVAFAKQWGWRFRFVGVTLFSVVLTVGLFALSLNPIVRSSVPGAIPYKVVFDRSGPEVTITVPAGISVETLDATLRQAASNLFSPGRNGRGKDTVTIRARTVVHVRDGVSQPVYVGEVVRSLRLREDPNMVVSIFPDQLAITASAVQADQKPAKS